MPDHLIRTESDLQALYEPAPEASRRKEVDHLHPVYQQWLQASPFAVIATSGPGGLDVSPRGDPAPLVRVADERTLLLPERRGNNRVDGLRNLVVDPRVSLLFLIPGVGETLRVNGKADISVEPQLLESFAVKGALPKCVLVVHVEAVYFQCARAMMRSGLWTAREKPSVPTAGTILAALTDSQVGGEAYDRELPERLKAGLY